MEKAIQKINFISICFLIIYTPLIYFLKLIFSPFKILNGFLYFYEILYLFIPIGIFIYVYNLIKKNIKITKYDIFIYILIILGIIVTINAVDVKTSIYGAYLRNEGLLSLLSYYLLFLNSRSLKEKEIKKIINILFIVGIFQFIYSFLQVFVRGEYVETFSLENINYMASGFSGNPNMLGSYCILLLGISIMYYLIYHSKKYLILSVIFYINLIFAQSTGPFFTLIFLLIFIIIFLHKKNIDLKKVYIILSLFFVTFILVSNVTEFYVSKVFNDKIEKSYTIKGDILNTLSLFSNSSGNDNEVTIDNYGSGRFTIWKNTMKIVPKYFWLGSGIDNFGYVYKQSVDSYCDKAHNEYLQILVTEGIFTLITYLSLLFNLFIDGIKSKNKLVWVLLMSFIGYAVQAFLNISSVLVAPIYFIIIGMLSGLIYKDKYIKMEVKNDNI